MADASGASAPPPKKKSFFKKASWQKAEAANKIPDTSNGDRNDAEKALDFFSKRGHFHDIIAEQTRKAQEVEKKKRDAEAEGEEVRKKEREVLEERGSKRLGRRDEKRRRISVEEDSDYAEEKNQAYDKTTSSRRPVTPPQGRATVSHTRHTRSTNGHGLSTQQLTQESVVIDLSDDEPDFKKASTEDLYKSASDDEDNVVDTNVDHDGVGLQSPTRGTSVDVESDGTATPTSPHDDEPVPTVKILVTSPIKDTVPLIVQILISMRLGMVKEAWCQKNNLPEELSSTVYFTHKNKRLYDVTTVKALGVTVDNADELGNIHVEAVTAEIHEEMKKQALKPKASDDLFDNDNDAAQGTRTAVETRNIKIILKAKGLVDFKLMVKPDTTFQKIAGAFRSNYKISPEQKVVLRFDGDELAPHLTMEESEIEDMDVVEVHLS